MFYLLDGRKTLYQWDKNIKIMCEENITQAHFYFTKDEVLTCELKQNGIDGQYFEIPNILLQQAGNLRVYGYDETYTLFEQQFTIIKRPKPSDYIYEETEIVEIKNIVEEALQDAAISDKFKGDPGPAGPVGPVGPAPVRGIDYWTETDKKEITKEILGDGSISDDNLVKWDTQQNKFMDAGISPDNIPIGKLNSDFFKSLY